MTENSAVPASAEAAVPVPLVPYRGIQPYRFVDHPIFFERDEESQELLSLVLVYRGALLYGDSGAGKSSLVNAGLVARAMERGFRPERVRVSPHRGAELVVERIPSNDSGDVFLPSVFAESDDSTPRVVLSIDAFEQYLREHASSRPLIVFDQFEELVTLFDEPDREEIRQDIAGLLVRLLRDRDVSVKLLFAFREDYLASVKQLLAPVPELIDQALRLRPPAEESLTTIIRGPFERYPGHFDRELSPALAARLREKLSDRFDSGNTSLSEVQTVCLRLWQSEDPETLLEERGLQGLLEDYLGEELDTFPPHLKYPAVALLSGMVTSEGTRNVISAESLIAHVREEDTHISVAVLQDALERLESGSKLVRRERRRDLYLYEITSEFLVPWISSRREELVRTRERRRERRKLLLLGSTVCVLAILVAGAAILAVWALRQRDAARRGAASEASLVLASAANLQPHGSDTATLLSLAAFQASKDANSIPRDAAWRGALTTLETARLSGTVATLKSPDYTNSLAFSPSGRILATAGDTGTVRLWDMRTHRQIGGPLRGHTSSVRAVAFSPDGRWIASGGANGGVRIWNADSGAGQSLPLLAHDAVLAVAFSPDGRTLAFRSTRNEVRLWNPLTRRPLGQPIVLNGPPDRFKVFSGLAFGPDGRTLAAADTNDQVQLIDMRTHAPSSPPLGGGKSINDVAFSPDGAMVAAAYRDGVWLWNVRTQTPGTKPLGKDNAFGVAFRPKGDVLAVAGRQGVQLWDVRTRRPITPWVSGPSGGVVAVGFSPDGRELAAVGEDGAVRLLDATALGHLSSLVGGHSGPVDGAVFNPKGTRIATAEMDGTVLLWDARTGTKIGAPMRGHKGRVWSVAFSPNGKLLASTGKDGTVRLWNASTAKPIAVMHQRGTVWSAAFSPDGRILATGGVDRNVRLWDVTKHKEIGVLRGHGAQVNGVAFSPDGRTIASGASDDARLWNVRTQTQIGQPLEADFDGANGVAFSPDGRTLAVAGVDGNIYFWDFRIHKQLGSALSATPETLFGVTFSPDGNLLASVGEHGDVRLWDMQTRSQLGPALSGPTKWVLTAAFSPDGRALVTASQDGTVHLWRGFLFSPKDIAYAAESICKIVGERTLTKAQWAAFAPGIHRPNEPICP